MKKFTSLLIGLSLALAGAAYAQQTEESPAGKKQGKEKTEQAETKAPKTHAEKTAKPEATAKQTGAMREHGATTEPGGGKVHKAEKSATPAGAETGANATTETGAGKGRKGKATEKSATSAAAGASASAEPSASAAPGAKHAGRGEKGTKAGAANAKASAAPSMTPATAAAASAAPSVAASASAAPSVATGQQSVGANANAPGGGATKHVETQKVQQVKQQTAQIKQQHANFKAQPRPDKVPPVTFNVNYRVEGSDRWQGPQYEVYRSYHPERHDRGWYSSHYNRVELIGGGYYYWNNGYWYPAWGYDPGHEYYAYDAPIYVGHRAEPPDRVIADVQAELQEMGYYQGEVDGLLGPLTREALTAYQADQGLTATAVIDEPTLDSLGMG
jgi:hypothetical protein